MFHKHSWKEISRKFVSPVYGDIEVTGSHKTVRELAKLLRGYSIIELECTKCGDKKFVEPIGDVR